MTNTWIVAARPQISALIDIGRARGGTITAVVAGVDAGQFAGVDRLITVEAGAGVPTAR